VHRPVRSRRFAELPGAVEGVDDPDPVRLEPDRVVLALLGEDGVARMAGGELPGQPQVRLMVSPAHRLLGAAVRADRPPDSAQQLPRLAGKGHRIGMVPGLSGGRRRTPLCCPAARGQPYP